MVFSAGFGLLTFVLNRQKKLGAIGITLTLVAMWLGGTGVQVGPRYEAPGYIGMDWFILDLLASALVFIFLEKIAPRIRDQAILRPDFWHDARYFVFNHLAIAIFLFASVTAVPTLFSWASMPGCRPGSGPCPGRAVRHHPGLRGPHGIRASTAPCTRCRPSGGSMQCTTASSTWTGSPARACTLAEPLVTRALVMLPAFCSAPRARRCSATSFWPGSRRGWSTPISGCISGR